MVPSQVEVETNVYASVELGFGGIEASEPEVPE
jgi:hypothetical protein